jgi:hypothetical protein
MKLIIFRSFVFILWCLLSLISLNHIRPFADYLHVSNSFLGILGWLTLILTICLLSGRLFKQGLLIFLTFLCLGYFLGPYLEPPSDPIDHLNRTYSYCGESSNQVSKIKRGFWHYNMSGTLICPQKNSNNAVETIRIINGLHGVYLGILMVVLFLLSKAAGLPDRWAFISCIMAFLFFGTNRFSYFSYYSFAPSFTSLAVLWMWTGSFFFKKRWKDILFGLIAAIIGLPVLWVNHLQESIFLVIIAGIWICWNLHENIWLALKKPNSPKGTTLTKYSLRILYFCILGVIFFLLPQFEIFRKMLSPLFLADHWDVNQHFVYFWNGIHLMGKIWGHRINDTLGLFGLFPLILMILFSVSSIWNKNKKTDFRVFLLGVVPFVIYLIPLNHFIWLSNVKNEVYWRICYISMFWIPVTYCCYWTEGLLGSLFNKKKDINLIIGRLMTVNSNYFSAIYFSGCMVFILLLSGIRSGPVYGKLDFILLNSRPWWTEWHLLIDSVLSQKSKYIYSDPTTSSVFQSIFGQPALHGRERGRRTSLSIETMESKNARNGYRCIVNLKGFTPSWVPAETGHWNSNLAQTSLYYNSNGLVDIGLKNKLKEKVLQNCKIIY